jgi:hypothetical protein
MPARHQVPRFIKYIHLLMNVNFTKITHEYTKNLMNDRIPLKKGAIALLEANLTVSS